MDKPRLAVQADKITFLSPQSATIRRADALDFLSNLPDEFADIIFLDPPFNIGKQYDLPAFNDSTPLPTYVSWLRDILRLSIEKLAPGGALYFYNMPEHAVQITDQLNQTLSFRHWIAVSMKGNFARGQRLYPAHYALLYYTKGTPKTFTRPKLQAARCRKCGSTIKDYGGYWSLIKERGINLSDIWDDTSPNRHRRTKFRAANELPRLIFDRVCHISGAPGAVVVDPFMGSGGLLISAWDHDLVYFGCDLSQNSLSLVATRAVQYATSQMDKR
jgi:site-specific DNA-methyltransferase (adenine-specific)